MAYRMSCDIPQKITAMATFISTIGRNAIAGSQNAPPIPIMITNGTADTVFKWEGGKLGLPGRPLIIASSAEENLNYWRKRNKITEPADSSALPDFCPGDSSQVMVYTYNSKYKLVFYKVINGGHTIPFKSILPLGHWQNCDYYALETAWKFLLKQRKQY